MEKKWLYNERENVRSYYCIHCKRYLVINPYIGRVEYCFADDIILRNLDVTEDVKPIQEQKDGKNKRKNK